MTKQQRLSRAHHSVHKLIQLIVPYALYDMATQKKRNIHFNGNDYTLLSAAFVNEVFPNAIANRLIMKSSLLHVLLPEDLDIKQTTFYPIWEKLNTSINQNYMLVL